MLPAALLMSGALVFAQQAAPPPDAADNPTTIFSIDRIRAALEIPQSELLMRREITPDFVVNIRERERFEKLMKPLDFRSGPVPPGGLYAYEQLQRSGIGMAQPLFLFDLMTVAHGINKAMYAARSAAARRTVERAIAEYCAAQPNGGAGIQLCMNSPAVR
jgi:hypothetical protein